MSLSTGHVAQLVLALAVLVVAAHVVGYLFARFRQPAVIGEIVGGLIVGPTALGQIAPNAPRHLFPGTGPVAVALAAVGQIGLLLLMFLASAELRVRAGPGERRTATAVGAAGLLVPLAVGVGVIQLTGYRDYAGPAGTAVSVSLVFGIGVAVAAIPIIARIMMDLGITRTPFARIVLMVAVAEDAALYILLAVVLGLAQARSTDPYGLWSWLGTSAAVPTVVYYVAVTLALFGACAAGGPRLFRWLAGRRWNVLERRSPTAFRLAVLFVCAAACTGLGINPIFGALLAGFCVARGDAPTGDRPTGDEPTAEGAAGAWRTIRGAALSLFVPVYFALVGVQLDLARQLDAWLFVWFVLLACAVKGLTVWLTAVLAGEQRGTATRLAVALNARGTPGVLVASVTYGAGVINARFFAVLVLMSIVTCEIAGFWLDRAFGGRRPAHRPVAPAEPSATSGIAGSEHGGG